ncbi:MAG: single-stranded DNA-binding protein [Lentisphaerae bacterium RIFOXYA12_FULL_48_11]|nr:MAG: single-stranded DNA-binding protein [Lentisphaerae bacterium RIFOXYA12_FULL_48_11]
MANLNKVFLIGNLTKDPELRYTPSGRPVTNLSMAINRKYKTTDGKEKDEVCFADVVAWNKQAEACADHLSKGSPVFVEGRLQYETWEKDGEKKNRLRVIAERIQFLSRAKKETETLPEDNNDGDSEPASNE